jgi:NADH:ubiquinone oxidoreductase subunit 3 (subunit A)
MGHQNQGRESSSVGQSIGLSRQRSRVQVPSLSKRKEGAMTLHYSEFILIFIYLAVAFALAVLILGASYFIAKKAGDSEKLSAYECGFDPFEDARNQFDVRFYLVAILFIIFDLEASFLFPWAVSLNKIGAMGFWTMLDFLFELGVGYYYAWKIGALDSMSVSG